MVMVTGFLPLSFFVMVMFQQRTFAHLSGLNPDSPGASTAFLANSRFLPASFPVGRLK